MRLIDADALIDDLMERYCKDCNKRKGIKNGKYRIIYEIGEAPCRACEVDDVKVELEEAPSADVPDRKVGEWIWEDSEERWGWACSNCGYGIRGDRSKTNYCPNCGAGMKGEDDDGSMPV